MKLTFLLSLLLLGFTVDFAGASEPPSLKPTDYLPGEFQTQYSQVSAGPPAKAYYWLYAAALDQFAENKSTLLSGEPFLERMVHRELENTLVMLHRYQWTSPTVDAAIQEATDLERFLAKGYRGKLRKDIESYILELRKNTKPK